MEVVIVDIKAWRLLSVEWAEANVPLTPPRKFHAGADDGPEQKHPVLAVPDDLRGDHAATSKMKGGNRLAAQAARITGKIQRRILLRHV